MSAPTSCAGKRAPPPPDTSLHTGGSIAIFTKCSASVSAPWASNTAFVNGASLFIKASPSGVSPFCGEHEGGREVEGTT